MSGDRTSNSVLTSRDELTAKRTADHSRQVIPDTVRTPDRGRQEMLHRIRGNVPACSAIVQQFLRGKPAINPSRNARARRRGLHPAEPARDLAHHLIKSRQPPGRVCAVASGHRKICRHKPG
jgi:hypothetical protein